MPRLWDECDAPTRTDFEETPRAWCPSCTDWVDVKTRDESFSYEAWGVKGVHRQYSEECGECGIPRAKLLDVEPINEEELES
jgi:hypothetical protein